MKKYIVGSLIFNIILIALIKNSRESQLLVFALWLINFIFLYLVVLRKYFKENQFNIKPYLKRILPGLFFIILIALIPRLFLINIYPFVSVEDELRDAGLHAMHLRDTNSIDIFGFGSYYGYGNFIPLISYFASFVIPWGFLIYMIPAAIVGTIAVCLLFLILEHYKGLKFAVICSTIFSVSLTQLHYSRTELLVILDTVLALMIFVNILLAQKKILGYLLLGLIAGLAWHLYAGGRIMLFCFLLILGISELSKIYKHIKQKKYKFELKRVAKIILYFFIGYFISLGPTVLFLSNETFFSQTGNTLIIFKDPKFLDLSFLSQIGRIGELYQQAFLSYTFTPSAIFHFKFGTPMLIFPLNFIFWGGLVYLFISRKSFFEKSIIAILFLHPLVSQVLINQINTTHRIQGIVPFANIVATYGIILCAKVIFKKIQWGNILIAVFLGIFFVSQLNIYFLQRVSDVNYEPTAPLEYVLQFAITKIAEDPNPDVSYRILNKSPYDINYRHFSEKLEFLTSPKDAKIVEKEEFNKGIKDALSKGTSKSIKFISFSPYTYISKDITDKSLTERKIEYQCDKGIFGVLYDCPKNYKGYSFYLYEII